MLDCLTPEKKFAKEVGYVMQTWRIYPWTKDSAYGKGNPSKILKLFRSFLDRPFLLEDS